MELRKLDRCACVELSQAKLRRRLAGQRSAEGSLQAGEASSAVRCLRKPERQYREESSHPDGGKDENNPPPHRTFSTVRGSGMGSIGTRTRRRAGHPASSPPSAMIPPPTQSHTTPGL